MGFLNKVFLVFDEPFWDTSAFWLNRIAPAEQVGQWTEFVSPYMYVAVFTQCTHGFIASTPHCRYTKQPMLIAFIAGDQATVAEREPSLNNTVQQVLNALNTMYPGKVPALEDLVFYDRYFWGQDPFSYGSYSFMANGTKGTVRKQRTPSSHLAYAAVFFF